MDVTALITARVESQLLAAYRDKPPYHPLRDWLQGQRAAILRFLSDGRSGLYARLRRLRAEIGRLRQERPTALGEATELGDRDDSGSHVTAEQWRHARVSGNLLAVGERGSAERTVQVDRMLGLHDRLVASGTFGLALSTPPWVAGLDNVAMKAWLLSKPQGFNFGLGVRAKNTHETRHLEDEAARKGYAIQHLGTWALLVPAANAP